VKLRVGVLASGRGSNLESLLRAASAADFPAQVVALASNRPQAPVLGIARTAGISAGCFRSGDFSDREARDAAMRDFFWDHAVQLVVNAGYDRILSPVFVNAFAGAILNVHPSLLPAFGGCMDAPARALAHGVRITGCTVHLVEGEVDQGPILLQAAVPVLDGDSPESLHARIKQEEHRLLPEAVRLFAEGRIRRAGRRLRVVPVGEPVA
jgi:phosphoribosylglycinamide formyltransferase-1